MDEDTIADLKQFITATISQQTVQLDEKIDALDQKLSAKIDDLSASVGQAIDDSNEANDNQLKDHETRITKLEQTAS
ncbi:MAG: hypothetical protein ACREGA_01560 [Candidatus Saccharimonadales bacterium]